jgi:hypothetical protein
MFLHDSPFTFLAEITAISDIILNHFYKSADIRHIGAQSRTSQPSDKLFSLTKREAYYRIQIA